MVNEGESNGRVLILKELGNDSICQRYLFYNDCFLPGLVENALALVVFHYRKYWTGLFYYLIWKLKVSVLIVHSLLFRHLIVHVLLLTKHAL